MTPTPPRPTRLGIMLRAHNRVGTLDIALSELARYGTLPGLEVHTCVLADRVPADVLAVIKKHRVSHHHSKLPVLSAGKDRFLESQNTHLQLLEAEFDPEWVLVHDDDYWAEPVRMTTELPENLANPDVDCWFFRALFMQDASNTYNAHRWHDSIRLFRHHRGFRWTGKRMLSVPDCLHDSAIISGRTGRFRAPLLEYGGFTATDRQEVYEAYKLAGKDDDFTKALVRPPLMKTFPKDYDPDYGDWKDLLNGS